MAQRASVPFVLSVPTFIPEKYLPLRNLIFIRFVTEQNLLDSDGFIDPVKVGQMVGDPRYSTWDSVKATLALTHVMELWFTRYVESDSGSDSESDSSSSSALGTSDTSSSSSSH